MGCVYSIVCVDTGKIGVMGSALSFVRAWGEDQVQLQRGRHPNRRLQEEFTRYGHASFTFREHESAISDEDLQEEIDVYIVAFGAMNSHQGYHSDRTDLMLGGTPESLPLPLLEPCVENEFEEAVQLEIVATVDEPAKKAFGNPGKPVLRVEAELQTGRFETIGAAAKAAKVTEREIRSAIRKGTELRGAKWVFADADA